MGRPSPLYFAERLTQQVLVALGRSESVTVLISGTEAEPGSSGYLVFDGVEQVAYLSVSDLPELTAEQDYQLWLIDGETPSLCPFM